MKRLIEKTVFSGFVIAWRLATWPTRISPSFVKATTDGVRRLPSWLGMTVGLPPSMTATTEFVVPRSMPITFAMIPALPFSPHRAPALPAHSLCGGGLGGGRDGPLPGDLENVDLDLARLELLGLRQCDLQHAVAVRRLHLVGLDGHRQLHQPLELTVGALDVEELLILGLILPAALTLDREEIAGDRHGNVLLANTGHFDGQDELVRRLVHVHRGQPSSRCG